MTPSLRLTTTDTKKRAREDTEDDRKPKRPPDPNSLIEKQLICLTMDTKNRASEDPDFLIEKQLVKHLCMVSGTGICIPSTALRSAEILVGLNILKYSCAIRPALKQLALMDTTSPPTISAILKLLDDDKSGLLEEDAAMLKYEVGYFPLWGWFRGQARMLLCSTLKPEMRMMIESFSVRLPGPFFDTFFQYGSGILEKAEQIDQVSWVFQGSTAYNPVAHSMQDCVKNVVSSICRAVAYNLMQLPKIYEATNHIPCGFNETYSNEPWDGHIHRIFTTALRLEQVIWVEWIHAVLSAIAHLFVRMDDLCSNALKKAVQHDKEFEVEMFKDLNSTPPRIHMSEEEIKIYIHIEAINLFLLLATGLEPLHEELMAVHGLNKSQARIETRYLPFIASFSDITVYLHTHCMARFIIAALMKGD